MNNKRLEEFDLIIGDGNYSSKYPKSEEFLIEGIPFLSASDFTDKTIDYNNSKKISPELHCQLRKGHVQKGDLLIVVRGNGVGKTGFIDDEIDECNINAQLAFIRSNDPNLDNEYLYYNMKCNYEKLRSLATGSAQPQLVIGNLVKYSLTVPLIEKQIKIRTILSNIDKKIKINNEINNNLLEQNKSLYNEWFVNFNFEYNGKKYKESNGEMINSEYGLIPKNWSLKRIDEMNLDISDGNYSSKYPTKQEFKDEGIPFIRGTDFVGYSISKKSLMFITPEKHSILKKGHLKKNDILITTRGEIGRIAFISDDFIDANINAQLIRVNGGSIYPRSFLGTALISDYIQNDIQSLVTGTALQQLPVGKFNQIKFLIPDDHKIIEKFDELAEYNLKLIQANEKENELLEQIRDTLLPKLMNGEIDLDNIEI